MPIPAHGESGRADRASEIEGEHLCAGIAPELQRHQRQEHALAGARRANHQRVADIADMHREAERRRSFGLGVEQRRTAQVLVTLGTRPDRRKRDHVRQIQRRDRRLADVGVSVSRQGPEPSLDRVDRLHHAGEVAALDGPLHQPQLGVGHGGVLVPDHDCRRDEGLADQIGPEVLERGVSVEGFVIRVGVQQRRRLVGHNLLQDRGNRLALGEPLPADFGDELGRIGLVETNGPGGPPVGEGQPVQLVEQAGPG